MQKQLLVLQSPISSVEVQYNPYEDDDHNEGKSTRQLFRQWQDMMVMQKRNWSFGPSLV